MPETNTLESSLCVKLAEEFNVMQGMFFKPVLGSILAVRCSLVQGSFLNCFQHPV